MARLLALEWNGCELQAVVASRRGDHIVLEQAFEIPLPRAEEAVQGPNVEQSIAETLEAHGIRQLDALVAVGRDRVELRQLQLPAAPDDELPGMVRLRATLEFNELDDQWLLDFLPLDGADSGKRNVLAAAIAPAEIDRIQAIGRQGGLKIQRVVLRSCAAAAMLARARLAMPGQVQLLVELFSEQVELTATVDGKLLLPRRVRWSGDASQPAALSALLTEIRLTMAAVGSQFSNRTVAGIVLCGRGEADAAIARQIEQGVGVRTALLDPFAGVELGPQVQESPPERPGRFAAVLGLLATERDNARDAVDFLHPRRTAVAANPRKKWIVAAVASALFVAAYIAHARTAYSQLDEEVRQLESRSAEAESVLRAAGNRNLAAAKEIADWADGEVVWLDRLRELSEDLPPAESVAVGHLSMSCQRERATALRATSRATPSAEILGRIHLEGRAKDSKAVTAMEQGLGAHGRRLESTNTNEDRSLPPYALKFRTAVQIGRGSKP